MNLKKRNSLKIFSKDKKHLERLRELNQNINSAMLLVEYFHKILDKTKVDDFRKGLKLWEELVNEAELTPFIEFLKTVRKYQERIEVYIRSRLTTAVSEGINNKIKVLNSNLQREQLLATVNGSGSQSANSILLKTLFRYFSRKNIQK